MVGEGLKRLTDVELAVFKELMELRSEHADISGAEFYGLMTDVHHTLERRWVEVLREVKREFAEAPA